MNSRLCQLFLILLLIVWAGGCAGILPQRATPEKDSKIVEEDIKADQPGRSLTDEPMPASPSLDGLPLPPSEQVPRMTAPGERPPRRFIWRDREGSQRGWEPVDTERER